MHCNCSARHSVYDTYVHIIKTKTIESMLSSSIPSCGCITNGVNFSQFPTERKILVYAVLHEVSSNVGTQHFSANWSAIHCTIQLRSLNLE